MSGNYFYSPEQDRFTDSQHPIPVSVGYVKDIPFKLLSSDPLLKDIGKQVSELDAYNLKYVLDKFMKESPKLYMSILNNIRSVDRWKYFD